MKKMYAVFVCGRDRSRGRRGGGGWAGTMTKCLLTEGRL